MMITIIVPSSVSLMLHDNKKRRVNVLKNNKILKNNDKDDNYDRSVRSIINGYNDKYYRNIFCIINTA